MNNFCLDCTHQKVPDLLKIKFNENVKEFWYECPINDKNIIGCTVKFLNIEWENFKKFLERKGLLSEDEKEKLRKSGW